MTGLRDEFKTLSGGSGTGEPAALLALKGQQSKSSLGHWGPRLHFLGYLQGHYRGNRRPLKGRFKPGGFQEEPLTLLNGADLLGL